MLIENFTTMKKISYCQIECKKALALIDKIIENQEADELHNSSGDLFAYEIDANIHFDWIDENENDYYTPEEQETARKLQDKLKANDIQSIIYFI